MSTGLHGVHVCRDDAVWTQCLGGGVKLQGLSNGRTVSRAQIERTYVLPTLMASWLGMLELLDRLRARNFLPRINYWLPSLVRSLFGLIAPMGIPLIGPICCCPIAAAVAAATGRITGASVFRGGTTFAREDGRWHDKIALTD